MKQDVSKMIMMTVLVEGIITYFNEFFVSGNASWQMIFSLVLGIVVAIAYKFDLPRYLNMESNIPYVGCILTGILISRGSNYIYDLISKLIAIQKL